MERMTQRLPGIGEAVLASSLEEKYTAEELIQLLLDKLAQYEDAGLDPDVVKALAMMCAIMKAEIDRLHYFEMAKNDNRIWEAPCKMGTTLYMIVTKRPKLNWPEFAFIKTTCLTEHNFFRVIRDFGKTVFLTRKGADDALAKLKEDRP